jgi:hypothetical protein
LVTSWALEYALWVDPSKGCTLARDEFEAVLDHKLKLVEFLVELHDRNI